ncbi:glycosyltransferase family 4 protein, partial [Bacillus sp. SIMBA_074]|uniref:glycosyltransferase family 4 protein n=1 Tax=Bacillus sp. SIMBA_074 TaxID=3085812 RepID=UPI00397CA735
MHTPLQHRIHECERILTEASDRVIVCSHYMGNEVKKLFHVASEKLTVIHNGVEAKMAYEVENQELRQQLSLGDGPILFFV